MTKPELWGVHVRGPDDLYACIDKAEAGLLALRFRVRFGEVAADCDVMFIPDAVRWPGSAESHASSLRMIEQQGRPA